MSSYVNGTSMAAEQAVMFLTGFAALAVVPTLLAAAEDLDGVPLLPPGGGLALGGRAPGTRRRPPPVPDDLPPAEERYGNQS
ncbi:hypothetical protein ACIQPT_20740 [Streptomyces sp. NPDC091289]|uniref:hypothetical protein n=1 Tax=Streptomyces sp. NPDC091289 TaxID=3365989 RepID=UPI00380EE8C7